MPQQTAARKAITEMMTGADPILGQQALTIYDAVTSMVLEESHNDHADAIGTLDVLLVRLTAHRKSLETRERCKRQPQAKPQGWSHAQAETDAGVCGRCQEHHSVNVGCFGGRDSVLSDMGDNDSRREE
jgi:hypothetical protein